MGVWTHYSEKPLTRLHKLEQPRESYALAKPRGLWLTDNSAYNWPAWCRENNFHLERLQVATSFELDERCVLRMRNISELEWFTREYGVDVGQQFEGTTIDWHRVSMTYCGVVITPYLYVARLDLRWYYGWDCASGCVWDPDVLTVISIEEVTA